MITAKEHQEVLRKFVIDQHKQGYMATTIANKCGYTPRHIQRIIKEWKGGK